MLLLFNSIHCPKLSQIYRTTIMKLAANGFLRGVPCMIAFHFLLRGYTPKCLMFLLTCWRLALAKMSFIYNPNPNPSIEGNSDMIKKPYGQLKYKWWWETWQLTDVAWPKWRESRQYENIGSGSYVVGCNTLYYWTFLLIIICIPYIYYAYSFLYLHTMLFKHYHLTILWLYTCIRWCWFALWFAESVAIVNHFCSCYTYYSLCLTS